jgi:hypothetical protein
MDLSGEPVKSFQGSPIRSSQVNPVWDFAPLFLATTSKGAREDEDFKVEEL